MPLLVEGHGQVVVLGHQRRLQDSVNSLDPLPPLLLGLGGELHENTALRSMTHTWHMTHSSQIYDTGHGSFPPDMPGPGCA